MKVTFSISRVNDMILKLDLSAVHLGFPFLSSGVSLLVSGGKLHQVCLDEIVNLAIHHAINI